MIRQYQCHPLFRLRTKINAYYKPERKLQSMIIKNDLRTELQLTVFRLCYRPAENLTIIC